MILSDLLKQTSAKKNISKLNDDLAYEILSVVEEIPAGRVATYGQIAKLIGRERKKNSRLVAGVLSHAENYGKFPCHRVVNHMGRLAPGWTEQEWLLERGRSYSERKWLCRFEEIFVGMLILERVYNDKEKSKTNTEYIFMVFTYCSTGKCFCTAVLQEAR